MPSTSIVCQTFRSWSKRAAAHVGGCWGSPRPTWTVGLRGEAGGKTSWRKAEWGWGGAANSIRSVGSWSGWWEGRPIRRTPYLLHFRGGKGEMTPFSIHNPNTEGWLTMEGRHARQERRWRERPPRWPVPADLRGCCFNCFSSSHRAGCRSKPRCFTYLNLGHISSACPTRLWWSTVIQERSKLPHNPWCLNHLESSKWLCVQWCYP